MMSIAESYLRTQRAAEALGVSVSTIKRWVDSGAIQAGRTQGRHRLIPLSEARRMAREQGLGLAALEAFVEGDLHPVGGVGERTVDLLEGHLREGRVDQARRLIRSLYDSGLAAVDLGDKLIRPVMARLGHAWQVGAIDVYQEHEATLAVGAAITDLLGRHDVPGDLDRPLALGATPAGDPYTLPGLLCELVLREAGWRTRHLGVNLPLRSLANAVLSHRPRLIFLSANVIDDCDRFVTEFAAVQEAVATTGAGLIVGGRALVPELRSRLVYASHGECLAHLAEFARTLLGDSAGSMADSRKGSTSRSRS